MRLQNSSSTRSSRLKTRTSTNMAGIVDGARAALCAEFRLQQASAGCLDDYPAGRELPLTNEVSFTRKIKEALLAMRIERLFQGPHPRTLSQRNSPISASALTEIRGRVAGLFRQIVNELTLDLVAPPKAPAAPHPVRCRGTRGERRGNGAHIAVNILPRKSARHFERYGEKKLYEGGLSVTGHA